ncbi:MAG: hypothetical protein ABIH41_06825 [Nanoarchaeota archaeon]
MVSSSVVDVGRNGKQGLEGLVLTFQLDRRRLGVAADAFCVDKDGRYILSYPDLVAARELVPAQISVTEFSQYVLVPLRRFADEGGVDGAAVLDALLGSKQENSERYVPPVQEGGYVVPAFLLPYFDALHAKGEVVIGGSEHIGKARGRHAANVLKGHVKRFIIDADPGASTSIRHDAGDSRIRLYFGDDASKVAFSLAYDAFCARG